MTSNPTTPDQAEKDFPTALDFASYLNHHWANQKLDPMSIKGYVLQGNTIGEQWLNWYATVSPNNPQYSLGQWEIVFYEFAAAQTFSKGLSNATSATEQAIGQIKQGTEHAQYLPNPLAGIMTGLSEFAAIFDAGFNQLTKISMWRSIGWTVLGSVLIVLGILWWAKLENVITI